MALTLKDDLGLDEISLVRNPKVKYYLIEKYLTINKKYRPHKLFESASQKETIFKK